jgi:hypothetical protein
LGNTFHSFPPRNFRLGGFLTAPEHGMPHWLFAKRA